MEQLPPARCRRQARFEARRVETSLAAPVTTRSGPSIRCGRRAHRRQFRLDHHATVCAKAGALRSLHHRRSRPTSRAAQRHRSVGVEDDPTTQLCELVARDPEHAVCHVLLPQRRHGFGLQAGSRSHWASMPWATRSWRSSAPSDLQRARSSPWPVSRGTTAPRARRPGTAPEEPAEACRCRIDRKPSTCARRARSAHRRSSFRNGDVGTTVHGVER